MKYKLNWRRLLAMALTIIMIAGTVPMNVFASDAAGDIQIIYTDSNENANSMENAGSTESTPVTVDEGVDFDFTNATADETGEGWTWANESKTLTLSGASITSAVVLPVGATIVVADGTENSVVVDSGDAIYSEGDITVSGTGKLTVESGFVIENARAIRSLTSITVENTELVAKAECAVAAPAVSIKNAKVDLYGYYYGIHAKTTSGEADSVVTLENVSGKIGGYGYGGINAHSETANVTVKLTACKDLELYNEVTNDSTSVNFYFAGIRAYTRGGGKDVLVELDGCENVSITNSTMAIVAANNANAANAEAAEVNVLVKGCKDVVFTGNTSCYSAIFVNNYGIENDDSANLVVENSTVEVNAPNATALMTSTKSAPSTVCVDASDVTITAGLSGIRTIASSADYADTDVKSSNLTFTQKPSANYVDESVGKVVPDEEYADENSKVIAIIIVKNIDELKAALNYGGEITLGADITVSEKLTVSKDTTIKGAYTLTRGIAGTIFAVGANATLTLDGGVVIDGANDWTFDSENFYADLAAAKTGSDNYSYSTSEEGGLVSTAQMFTISATNGAVVMNNATIQNVWTTDHNNAAIFSVPAGATLTVNDGALIQDIRGSVVGQIKGAWIMNGGKITGVHGHSTNGCLSDIRGGVFTINDGEICNNTLLGLNNNGSGILAQVYGTSSKLIVNGGNIHDNANFCPGGGWGSIVYLNNGGNFEMNGGTIGNGNSDKCTTIGVNDSRSTVALNAGTINVAKATAGSYDSLLFGNVSVGAGMTISGGDVRFCGTPDNTLVINGTVNSNMLLRAENVTNNGVVNGNVIITKDSWAGNSGNVTISGGTWNGTFTVTEGASLSITGGTFKEDPTPYLAETAKITKLADGTYGVENLDITVYKVSTKAELADAIAKAADGDKIKLTADIDYGTDHIEINNGITLDLGGKTLTTRARNHGLALKNDYIVVTNGKLNHAGTVAAIKLWNAKEISDLEIDVTGTSSSGNAIGGIVIQENAAGVDVIKNVTIHSTAGQGVANGIETYNCGNATEPVIGSMENVTIDATGTGMLLSAPCGTATGCTIKGGVSGIDMLLKGTYSVSIDLVNCTVEGGEQAVYAHDEQKGYTYVGSMELTADEDTDFVNRKSGVLLTKQAAETTNVVLPSVLVDGAVAIVNGAYHETLAEAVTAANIVEGGATVTLLTDVTLGEKLTISGNVTISGAKTITRDDAYTGTLFTVNAGATLTLDGGLVIDGGNEWTLNKELYNKALNREVTGTTWADLITSEEAAPSATAPMFLVNGAVVANNVTIQNNYSNKSSNNGDYGVFKVEANATLTMTGATVKHIVTGGANSVAHLSTNSVWTINDGTLITDTFAGKNGGICRNDSGMLVMNGGKICTNYSIDTNGTVVMLYKGSMEMNGGTICHNTGISGNANGRCAPIYGHSTSTFVMNDGTITENQGVSYGGVDVPSSIKVEINGGYVGDNISSLGNTNADINGNSNTVITGGTFTQDVSAWLAPDTGLVYDETTGTYVLTKDLYEYNGVAYKSLQDVINAIKNAPTTYSTTAPTVKVLASHKIDETVIVDTAIVLDLGGNTITTVATAAGEYMDAFTILADVTITGEGTIDARPSHGYTFYVGDKEGNAGNLTIENGTFYGETSVVNNRLGTVTINGGEFAVSLEKEGDTYDYVLNCADENYKNGTAKIEVNGGTFYKFNPENNAAEGVSTNFLTEQYIAVAADNDAYTVKHYIAWVKAELLAGRDVTLDRDIVLDDISYVEALKAASNGNGKYCGFDYGNGAFFNIIGDYDVTFDLNGHSITYDIHDDAWCNKRVVSIFYVTDKANLTIIDSSEDKTGTVTVYGMASAVYSVAVDTKVDIQGGTWTWNPCKTCGATNIFLYASHGGELYITGGFFDNNVTGDAGDYMIFAHYSSKETTENSAGVDYDSTKIAISGGIFENYNPGQIKYMDNGNGNAEKMDDGCENGYTVKDNGDGTYSVQYAVRLYLVDPITGKPATIPYLEGTDIASIVAIGKSFYADYYEMTLELLNDFETSETIVIDYPMTVNLNGKTITTAATAAGEYMDAFTILADVTITGEGTIDARPSHGYTFYVGDKEGNAGNLTIENGTFYGESSVVNNRLGTVTINGGEFAVSLEKEGDTYDYVLNCVDDNYNAGTAKIEVNGGKFKNFDPANNAAEGTGTVFTSANYTTSGTPDANGYYTVVTKTTVTIGSVEDLLTFASAVTGNTLYQGVKVAANPDAVVLLTADLDLADSGFAPIGNGSGNAFAGTFDGQGHTISNMTLSCDYYRGVGFFRSLAKGAVVKNVTFDNANVNNGAAKGVNHFYGVVAGFSNNLTLDNVDVKNSTVTCKYAGAVMVGCLEGETTIKNCDMDTVTLTTTDVRGAVYGILGNSASGHTATLENNTVKDVVFVVNGEIKPIRETLAYGEWNDGNEYAEATYVAQSGDKKYSSLTDALAAAVEGDTITLIDDVVRAETLVINKKVTLDLGGNTITTVATAAGEYMDAFTILADVTITGEGTVDARPSHGYTFYVGDKEGNAGNLTIENGTFYGESSVVNNRLGTVTINGGEFAVSLEKEGDTYDYVLNCVDDNYNAGTAKFNITGGTFHNWNPADNKAEGAGTNFVADGYKAKDNGDSTYTVIEANYVAQVGETKYESLSEAIAAAVLTDEKAVTVLQTIVLTEDATLDLQGVRLNAAATIQNAPVFRVLADVTVTNGIVDGRGPVAGEGGINCYAFIVGDNETAGTLTITSGTYRGVTSAISITNGTVNISGGTFQTGHDNEGTDYGTQYLLNCMDTAYKNGTAKFNITGGKFVGFNPENNAAESANTNFLTGNYKASDYYGDNKWYVAEANVVMDGDKYFATIKDALAILTSADTTVHTVKVLNDLEIDVNYSTYNYPILVNGFAIELDLNGKTITADWSKYTGSRIDNALIGVCNGGKLTVIDSVGDGKIVNNDNKDNVENRIFWIMTSTATKSIEVVIKGGTFVQNETNTALLYVQGNKPSDNLAPIYVTIEGGHFETVNNDFFNAYDGYQHESYIIGGTFNKNPSDWEIKIHPDYEVLENADGTYGVVPTKLVKLEVEAIPGTWLTSYITIENWADLEAALGANTNVPVKVTLLDNVDLTDTVLTISGTADKVIDLNGYNLTGTVTKTTTQFIYVTGGCELTILDSSEAKTGGVHAVDTNGYLSNLIRVETDGKLVIESGNFTQDASVNGAGMIDSRGDEIITVNGGRFVLDNIGTAENGSPWIFNASSQNTKNIIVNGGMFNADIIHQYYPFEVMAPKEKALVKGDDGMWSFTDAVAYVNEQEWSSAWYTNEVGYATLEEAIAAVEDVRTKSGKTSPEEYVTIIGTLKITDTVENKNNRKIVGKIVLGAVDATLAAPENAELVVTSGVAEYKVVYEDGTYKLEKNAVAKIGETTYPTLAEAIKAAVEGDTIVFLDDITEDVTFKRSVTIDGGNFKYTGTMTGNVGLNVTVQNVNFVNGGFTKTEKSATGTYTIKNCTFDGEGVYPYSLSFRGANKIVIEDCTVKNNLYSFLYVLNGTNTVSVKNVTVEDCPNYAIYFASGVNNATIENLTVKNSNNAFIYNNTANRAFTIKNCKLENVTTAIGYTGGTNTITCTVLGNDNDFGAAALSQYAKLVLGEVGATLTAPEGLTVTSGVEGYSVVYKDGAYKLQEAVAKIGDKYFASLQEAIDAALDNDTVVLLKDIELGWEGRLATSDNYAVLVKVEEKSITLDMNGKQISVDHQSTTDRIYAVVYVADGASLTVTGNGKIDVDVNETTPKVAYLFWKRGTTGTLTIEDGYYHMDDSEDSMVYTNGSEIVTVQGGTFILDAVGADGNGFPCHFNAQGQNEKNIIVTGGTYNADINHQKWCFEVNISETKALQYNEETKLWTVVDAEACVYEPVGIYTHKVGYATFAEAYAAAQAGETIVLLADATLTEKLTINKAITIDGNGYSIIADETAVWYTVSGKFNIKNYNTHLVGVNSDNVTLKNVVLDCNNNAAGINVYCAQNVVFDNVSIVNATKGFAALTVNGSTLTFKNEFTALGNAIALDISNGSGVTSTLGVTVEEGTVFDLGNKTVKFASVATVDTMSNAVDANGDSYFAAMDNAYYYTQAQMDARTTAYSNGLKLLDDVTLSKNLEVKDTFDLNDKSLTMADGVELRVHGTVKNVVDISGKIVFYDTEATLEGPAGLNVSLPNGVTGYRVVYENGVYKVVEINYVAQIEDVKYESIQAAVDAAQDGDVITVIADHELVWDGKTVIDGSMAAYVCVAGKSVTIDLNGKKLTGDTDKMTKTLYAAFAADEGGSLTLKDSSEDKTGSVTVTGDEKAYSLLMGYEAGTKLTVEGGAYHLDNATSSLIYGGGSSEILYINGGNFTLGNIGTGANGSPWIFNLYKNNEFHATVTGGTYNANVFDQYWRHEVQCDGRYAAVDNGNGTWTVFEAKAYVIVNENGYDYAVGYATFAEAYEAAQAGETITIIADLTINVDIDKNVTVVKGDKNVTVTGKFSAGTYDWNVKANCADGYYADNNGEGTWTVKAMWKISGTTITLNDTLDLTFNVHVSNLLDDGYYAVITHNHLALDDDDAYTVETADTIKVLYDEWGNRNSKGTLTYKKIAFDGLSARQMTDKITVVVYDNNGTPDDESDDYQVSLVWEDSIRDYAQRTLANAETEKKVRTVVVDMLNYGAAAQETFGYRVDDKADSILREADQAEATANVTLTDNRVVEKDKFLGTTITLKNKMILNLYFKGVDPDTMTAKATFTNHNGKDVEIKVGGTDGVEFAKHGSYYGVSVDEIKIADAFCVVEVVVYDSEGNVYTSAKDSISGYLARMTDQTDPIYMMAAKFAYSALEFTKK